MKQIYDPATGTTQYMANSADASKNIVFVQDINERNSLHHNINLVWVEDATLDNTVVAGGAMYGKNDQGQWVKLSEAESFDQLPSGGGTTNWGTF